MAEQAKYSIYTAPGDGLKTNWDFNFAGAAGTAGYISKDHVVAYRTNRVTLTVVALTFTWVGPNTIHIEPAVPATDDLTIRRMTPKVAPLVDYTSGSLLNERNLDSSNRQAIYAVAELVDAADLSDGGGLTESIAFQAIDIARGAKLAADAAAPTLAGFSAPGVNAVFRTVADRFLERISIKDYASLRDAINALPSIGGVIEIPPGRYPAGVWKFDSNTMRKANVKLRGWAMPVCALNCDRLDGGSIIEGRLNVWADHFSAENLGFDLGKYVVDTYYGGLDTHTPNHPHGDTWDAFAFAQPAQSAPEVARRDLRIHNVIGLSRDSQSYGHAVLLEGFDGLMADNVIGVGGIHGVVFKGKNGMIGSVGGYSASGNHVIIKSDSYAHGGNLAFDYIETGFAPPGTSPWFVPATPDYALYVNPATDNMDAIKINQARLYGAKQSCVAAGPFGLDDFHIGTLECQGQGVANAVGINFTGALRYNRVRFGNVVINNMADAVAYKNNIGEYGADSMDFESLTITNVTLRAIQALGFGRMRVGRLRVENSSGLGVYAIDPTARVLVGKEDFVNIGGRFVNNPPAFLPGWSNLDPGFAQMQVRLHNYGVRIQGMVHPESESVSGSIVSLPQYLRAPLGMRVLVTARNTANVNTTLQASLGDVPDMRINDGANAAGAGNFLSLQTDYSLD